MQVTVRNSNGRTKPEELTGVSLIRFFRSAHDQVTNNVRRVFSTLAVRTVRNHLFHFSEGTMQFIVIGKDGTDAEALERRMKARPAHIELGTKLREEGKQLFGVAILDDSEKMVGSLVVCEFDSREALDEYLAQEPYVTGGVWSSIEVLRGRVGPSFAKR